MQQWPELRSVLFIEVNDLTADNRIIDPKAGGDLGTENGERFVRDALPRNEASAAPFEIGQRSESIIFEFVEKLGMIERFSDLDQRHRLELRQKH